ncbi:uncharacterized protein [Littorina saxatilis]|uniref:uncharacterized protein isoform X2 n=1 Tax=Littorina saxatilis TaxID=31220 RepID=UPI0038B41B3A
MLLERCQAGAAVCVSKMAAKADIEEADIHAAEDDNKLDTTSDLVKDTQSQGPSKVAEAFEVDFGESMPENSAKNLQEAFKNFKKLRQDDIRQTKRMLRQQKQARKSPQRMQWLRDKFMEQCKKYFGVPYAKKYWSKDTVEYHSPVFLDCCGLVRQVMRDLQRDFGFRIGPWNQAYMYDTLPLAVTEEQMKPGDLVFMTGTYVNPKSKKQRHNMMHVEVWLGDGPKTIGARWNKGKVQVFDSYRFDPKSFQDEQYYFRSIDTWLMGICKSYCAKHKWGTSTYNPSKKSVFYPQQNLSLQDQKAGDDSDDNGDNKQGQGEEKGDQNDDRSSTASQQQQQAPQQSQEAMKKKKRPKKVGKVVSKNTFLPQGTKSALMELEDRIDNMVARKADVFGIARQQCPGKTPRGMKGRVMPNRPATSMDHVVPAHLTQAANYATQLRCPVVGDCNSQPMQYVPHVMPTRYGSPLTSRRPTPSTELPDPRRLKWLDSSQTPGAVVIERGGLPQRAAGVDKTTLPVRPAWTSDGRASLSTGLLTVVSASGEIRKNKSCTDLEVMTTKPKPNRRGPSDQYMNPAACIKTASGVKPWRHSAPENLLSVNSLSFSAQFVQQVRESTPAFPATPSLAATCSSDNDDNDDDDDDFDDCLGDVLNKVKEEEAAAGSGSDGETSNACGSDCGNLPECDDFAADDDDDMDTEEELEMVWAMDCVWADAYDDDNDDDEDDEEEEFGDNNVGGAVVSFTNKSEWNVSDSQSYTSPRSGCSLISPQRSETANPTLMQRRQKSFLLPLEIPLDVLLKDHEQNDDDFIAGNVNNNSSRPRTAHASSKSRKRPQHSRSSTDQRTEGSRSQAEQGSRVVPTRPVSAQVPSRRVGLMSPYWVQFQKTIADAKEQIASIVVDSSGVEGSSLGVTSSAPVDGDGKTGGESAAGPAGGNILLLFLFLFLFRSRAETPTFTHVFCTSGFLRV